MRDRRESRPSGRSEYWPSRVSIHWPIALASMRQPSPGASRIAIRPPAVSLRLMSVSLRARSSMKPPSRMRYPTMRTPSASVTSGTLTTPAMSKPGDAPSVAVAPALAQPVSRSSTTGFEVSRITPPIAPDPYSVPCGPSSTSTLRMSYSRSPGSGPE